jgi:tetratricopeptide (TPR) repeat protein
MDALLAELTRDPRRRGRRLGWLAVAALSVFALGASGLVLARRSRSLCAAGPERLAGVWEGPDRASAGARRGLVRAAILSSGAVVESTRTWERVAALLDRHAGKWLDAYRDACEATHVRGDQSNEVLDLRMSCLDDDLDSTRALTQLLSSGDRAVIDHAVEAAGALGDLSRCGAAEQVRSGVRPPRDPLVRKNVEEARRRLKEGGALRQSGQMERAVAIADAVLARPEAATYCPLQAEALLLKGMAVVDAQRADGVNLVERSVETAERCGHDRVVAMGLSTLVYQHRVDDWPAAEREARLTAAVLARMGGDAVIEGWLANNLGVLWFEEGKQEDARRETERAIALKERTFGSDNLDVAISSSNLAWMLAKMGRFAEASAAIEKALSVERRWVQEDTLLFANVLLNDGDVLLGQGRLAEAADAYERSRVVLERRMSPDSPDRLDPVRGLATIALRTGRVDEAIEMFERILRAKVDARSHPTSLAEAQFNLAVALDRAGREPTRARELARAAASAYAQQPAFAPQRREVDAWLAERDRRTPRSKGI